MHKSKEGGTYKQNRIFWNIEVAHYRQQSETDTKTLEDVGLDCKQPQKQNEIADTSPDGEGFLKLGLRAEVDVVVDDEEGDSAYHEQYDPCPKT